jgi:hypothetical protein
VVVLRLANEPSSNDVCSRFVSKTASDRRHGCQKSPLLLQNRLGVSFPVVSSITRRLRTLSDDTASMDVNHMAEQFSGTRCMISEIRRTSDLRKKVMYLIGGKIAHFTT